MGSRQKPKHEIAEKQKLILKLVYEEPRRQNILQQILKISAPALLYHLEILESQQLIKKTTISQIGNARINEITIDALARQRVRAILGFEGIPCALISGFGSLVTGYRVPDISLLLLEEQGYKIDRLVCFTSSEAKIIREEHEALESLRLVDQYYTYEYPDFRNFESPFFDQVEELLQEEMQSTDVILDLTPLSKLYSFKMLEIANRYHLPCFYLGQDAQEQYFIIWLSHIQLNGGLNG